MLMMGGEVIYTVHVDIMTMFTYLPPAAVRLISEALTKGSIREAKQVSQFLVREGHARLPQISVLILQVYSATNPWTATNYL